MTVRPSDSDNSSSNASADTRVLIVLTSLNIANILASRHSYNRLLQPV
jgi:hypothetical protein